MRYGYPLIPYEERCRCKEPGFLELILISETETEDEEKPSKLYVPSEGRQLFTRWRWSYPNPTELKSKTFYMKYEKKLSTVEKILLNNFQQKYFYHAIDDILYSLKSKPTNRDNLLSIIYSPVLSLQNNFSIDFFDIWIDEIYINEVKKSNKFLSTNDQNLEPFCYITLKFLYTSKRLTKKTDSFW
jgi:hypothetical protein